MRILVVEDDPAIRAGLVDLLVGHGYVAIGMENAANGLAEYRRERPHFVILDVMMPGESGYEVCRKIRASDDETPILFLTAKSEEVDRVLGLELGADDYVIKPFGAHEIIARVRAITRRCYREKRLTATAPFRFGDLTVEPSELRAKRGEVTIDLSLRELALLELFARNPGKVLTRDELLDHAWGKDYVPNSRTLDQHISVLRRKVELDPAAPRLIQTVHGSGYRCGVSP
jgi:DNA-binding response OmpR family regulator